MVGEMLAWASADELAGPSPSNSRSDAKAFWKDGFLLYTLMGNGGDFCGMIRPEKRSSLYPLYSEAAFISSSAITASQISPEEGSRRHQGIQGIQPVRG